ncbi:glycosyltransferase family 4 protein [Autumnicola musiva]|uniref:Glycosyltransferase family 4 protein n=1 Tax=Autumnicola musiva TaxID=3075589 RepID=A0ABU3D2T3_9FLAO|nr:glycosyltransferase family 4 protein [Zunongwangia sp. F117]MDT0675837.1 glycosyltransferase family 4 protein [Zunongwangia sp. F117]
MKIVVMGNNALMGGLIVHYIVLCRYLKKAGHDLFLINVNDNDAHLFEDGNIPEISVPYITNTFPKKLGKYLKLRKACRKAKSFNPDLFIATGYGHGYSMVAGALPASTFKFFEEVHFEAHNIPLKLKMVRLFDAIAPQTEGMIEIFKKNVSADKPVAWLPCFSKEYKSNRFESIPSSEGTIKLAYFGRLEWNKGIRQFVTATRKIFKNKDVVLDIYGKGSEAEDLQKTIKSEGLEKKVIMRGFYQDEDFAGIISACHGVVIPSVDTEGLPLIVIEAMRYGRPILCTTTGAMPEVARVNKDGMVVSGKEPGELIDNLKVFIGHIKAESFSAQDIHQVYRNYFSNAAFWEIWEEMLQNPKAYFTAQASPVEEPVLTSTN